MLRIDRRLITNFDWVVLGTTVLLSLIGIMTIYSATRPLGGGEHPSYYIKQLYWLLIGLGAMLVVVSIDYSYLNRYAYAIFGGGMALLVAVLVMGRTGLGATRWISLGPISFQPSDLFKLAYIITMAHWLSRVRGELTVRDLVFSFVAFTAVPLLLIIKQPDLGTGLIMLMLFTLMSLTKGVQKKVVMVAVTLAVISVPFVGNIFWDELKDYQKMRIVAFVQPDVDPAGVSYHINQSKVAIGSGGITGKGYLKGTQGPFRFLPEKHTDFIFSVFAEEWGFLGALALLAVYLTLIMKGINIAVRAKDAFGRLLALGITFMYTLYMFINVGMTLGVMPVVGIPLPFMSYGGTALVTNFIAAGLLINIKARRFELFY
jgi:rod shape determining protein RodA